MNRVVLLTGASRGIGREAALALAEAGCDLVLAARSEGALRAVAEDCSRHGVRAIPFACDLLDDEDLAALVAATHDFGEGRYPVLVNNAGFAAFGDTASMDDDDFDRQFLTNFAAPTRLTRQMLPWMLRAGGHVVNLLSIAAKQPFAASSAYCASKAALLMFGRSLSLEYRGMGLRVTSLIPGSTATELWLGKEWRPPEADMLSAAAVAAAIRDVVVAPLDRNYDEVVLMPPKGIL